MSHPQRNTKSHVRRARGAADTQTRTDHDYTWLACSSCDAEIKVPKDVGRVTCGRCVQRKVAPPPKPLSTEERIAKMKADWAARHAAEV
jgi:hypothetical protein